MNVYLNIKMENNSSGKKKKGVSWVVDKLLNLFLIAFGVVVIWILLQVTSIATFKIPSDSMEPALLAGDNILVNKWVMGGRIFNIWDALEGKRSRLPVCRDWEGYGGMMCWFLIFPILHNGTV